MYCNNCGRQLTGREKFCPECGNLLPDGGSNKKKEQHGKIVIFVPAFLVVGFVAVFLIRLFLMGGTNSAEVEERYETASRISDQVDEIIAPWLNENRMIDYDEDMLQEAAKAVYDYALDLVDSGEIEDTAYCEEGASVSFFLNDGSTTVYLPSIQDTWAGEGNQGILTVNLTSGLENTGHANAGETIASNVNEFQTFEYDDDLTVAELKDILESMDENQIRALFWRGHGGIYTEKNGEVIFAFVLNEKMTAEKESLYAKDRRKPDDGSPLLLNICGGKTYGVNYLFFEKYTCEMDGGLFFTGSCYSGADGGRMADTLINKGFDAYVGASNAINILYSNEVLSETARKLTQMQNGCYTEIEEALDQAVTAYEGSFGENVNCMGGRFVMRKKRPFRLVDPYLDVTLDFGEEGPDLDQLSIHVMQTLSDGTTEPYNRRINGSELKDGSFSVANIDPSGTCQIDINYGSWQVKTVTLKFTSMVFENNAVYAEIPLALFNFDIILEDEEDIFVSEVSAEVWAADDENGIHGLIQELSPSRNNAGEDVHRITLAPGTYTVRVISDDGTEIQRTVTVEGDMELRLSLDQNSIEAYAEIVRQYEDRYGELQFYEFSYSTNYTGVFLLQLVDFDQNGTEELVIGYSVPYPEGIEYCAWPSMDVWTIENGTPVRVYEDAYVQHGDIGRHCQYINWNGTNYLVTGWSGSDVDLELLKFENGEFVTGYTLKAIESMSGAYVTDVEYYLNNEQIDIDTFNLYFNQINAGDLYNGGVYESDTITTQDMQERLEAAKEQLGIHG